jgi:uncharacterized protein YijF (DUF1287 family)
MKKKLIIIALLLISHNSIGQGVKKDTLYFKFKNNYLNLKKNYENTYAFIFKNEKLVTSAFGNKIQEEDLFYFIGHNSNLNLKIKRMCNLKKYLKKRKNILIDIQTQKYDAYKLMQHFNKFIIFFLVDNKFIEVKASCSLGE